MTDDKEIRINWFNFLKAFTRGLVQINLYKPDHPQVGQTLEEIHALLVRIIEDSPDKIFTLALDRENLIVNGFALLTSDKLPNSLKNLFSRFRISGISFLPGVSVEDIRLLCRMQSFSGDCTEYIKKNNLDKITVTEAARSDSGTLDAATETAPERETLEKGTGQNDATGELDARIMSQNFEAAIGTIIAATTPDDAERDRVTKIVMAKFRTELRAQIDKALAGALREKEKTESDIARTEAVIANMAEGVVVVDKDGNILMMNPQAEVIAGKGLSDLAGRKIFDIAHIENQMVSLAWETDSDGSEKTAGDGDPEGKPDFTGAVKKSTAIIQNEDGQIVGSLSVPTDKIKLHEMEQLQQDFIANMTHELRSPLTSIKAALEILAKSSKPDNYGKTMINTAIRNSERLSAIITDILDFSKLQSGKLVFHKENIPSDEIAREAADAMKAWASAKSIDLKVSTEPGVARVYADKRRTVQILINLISNAIKFTPKGGAIEVSADNGRDAQSDFIFFSVKDNGCGIKKEDQSRIFEKFVQVTAGEKVSGTGLGLAITKAMAVMQNGRITLDSAQGRGSTFRVALPAYRNQLDTPVFEPLPEVKETHPWWKKLLGI